MKKFLVFIMSLVMSMSLVACGGEAEPETEAEPSEQPSVEEEQAKADEDFAQLQGFMNGILEIYNGQQEIATIMEEVKSGQKGESDLLDAYKQLADSSEALASEVQNATWTTNYYDDKVAALTECVDALALYQKTIYDAGAENDSAKLEEAVGYFEDYDAKLTTFLDIMGVE
ncbi:MAG: hypothetical protein RR048_01580 [Oscillospiraceae bacterium]